MNPMIRVLAFVTVAFVPTAAPPNQALTVLHIKVTLLDGEARATPVPRHGLLISDNPATATPRLIMTKLDGTADVELRPGNYTVESDKPVVFNGKAYQWTQTLDVVAGRTTLLELTPANADVESAPPERTASGHAASGPPLEDDPSFLLPKFQDSVVGIWTPTTHGSGFVVDAKGLVATNQRVIGAATSAEVQLTPAIKVAATVLASDHERDVAFLWVDPKAIASIRPVPINCNEASNASVVTGQEIFTIGVPLRQSKGMSSGTVSGVDATSIESDLALARGSSGGPVFTARGDLLGITSIVDESDQASSGDSRIIRSARACDVLAGAESKMKVVVPPSGAPLPLEPARPFPMDALKDAVRGRAGSLNPYQVSSADFDVAFITPVHTYGMQHQMEQARDRRTTSKDTRTANPEPVMFRPLMDFSNWSEYVWDFPSVLLVRVTPKFVEGFWTKVGRAAAQTQGVAIPPIKRFKAGFSRMRAFCGDVEVTPIHPFKLERRTSETEAIYEGLYVFDPGALAPDCSSVKLVLFSEKEPESGDTRIVDPKVIQQIWQDFEPYRASRH
jgi:S1-C subfamily serine protease